MADLSEADKMHLDNQLPAWGSEEKPLDDVTMRELDALCETAYKQKADCDRVEEELGKLKFDHYETLSKIQHYLTHFNKDKYFTSHGTVELRKRLSVKTPKSKEDKEAFFAYLTEKGVFWDMVNVNSQSLNAMYKEDFEIAKQNGTDCKIPGIGEPTVFEQIVLRKGK